MDKYICIHGHFYQPPRENPWLEAIELQDSAYPYHDWNERITAECYAANAYARILGKEGKIERLVNNYARISFNFGPTLLSWMEVNAPEVYRAILAADVESRQRFSGHGSAIAQAYNHMIMPLASRRDKYTQVVWGIKDFEHRFGRRPEGMWLPETAVDPETLGIMAGQGISFTILAPHQAKRVMSIREGKWRDVSGEEIDPTTPYTLRLPTGKTISLFFYNGPASHAVAFEQLLDSGEQFARRLLDSFSSTRTRPQLVNIATDGETYGHHHRFGDMALAYLLQYIESNKLAQLTNYGEFLEKHPPVHEVEISENTSWSCAHGVERWRDDCGCNTGMHKEWDQAWRKPLREAMDWLRDAIAPAYEEKAKTLLKDPWAARDGYIEVVLDRSPESIQKFLSGHASRPLSEAEKVSVLKLMELQRHAMLMFTSCGWFFDDISRIETVQVLQYAGKVIQLAGEVLSNQTESRFLEILEQASSNIPENGNGRNLYERLIAPARVDLEKVAAHFAVSSLFQKYGKREKIYCYDIDVEDYQISPAGPVAVGHITVSSGITGESALFSFAALLRPDHDVNAGVKPYPGEKEYLAIKNEIQPDFCGAVTELIPLLDRHFGESAYSLTSLFHDERRKAFIQILESSMIEIETTYRRLYEYHYGPLRFLADIGNPIPEALHPAVGLMLNMGLLRALTGDVPDIKQVQGLLDEVKMWDTELDTAGLGYALSKTLGRKMSRLASEPDNIALLKEMVAAVSLDCSLPFCVDLLPVVSRYYAMLQTVYPDFKQKAAQGDGGAIEWTNNFLSLGEKLEIEAA